MLSAIFAKFGVGALLSIFRGISGPIFEHYQAKDIQVTKRQGVWANTLMSAAQADVENRKTAANERANSKTLMVIYVLILAGPVLYYLLYWADTIFSGQVWRIDFLFIHILIWDWEEYVLEAAPADLAEMGKWIIGIFLGADVASRGVVKGAKVLSAAGIFKGK